MRAPYSCIRCGYKTQRKSCMQKHLLVNKNMCPGSENDIELTDEIKQYIIENRVYHIPKTKDPLHQTINNYNVMNNFIASMDVVEKLQRFTEFNNNNVESFEKTIEDKYKKKVKFLEQNQGLHLNAEDFIDIIDDVSNARSGDMTDFRVFPNYHVGHLFFSDIT